MLGIGGTELLSFIVGLLGTLASLIGIAVSVYLYRRAKGASSDAERAIARTLKVTMESKLDLESARGALATTLSVAEESLTRLKEAQAAVEQTSQRLSDVLELHAIERSSINPEDFIIRLIAVAMDREETLSVGDIRVAARQTRWTQVQARTALQNLGRLGRIRLVGDLDADATEVHPAD